MQTLIGQVISNKLPKTLTVIVRRRFRHPMYLKLLTRTKKYLVHNEQEIAVGETVKFVPCKPMSKSKKWKVIGVVDSNIKKATKANKSVDEVKTTAKAASKSEVKKDSKKSARKLEKISKVNKK